MPSYLVPPLRLSDRERQAIGDVGALMETADEQREDEEIQRQDNAQEDAQSQWDPASASESPSTQRILDAYAELRAQRGGAAAPEDFYLADIDHDEAELAETDDAAVREARAVASVGKLMNAGVVRYDGEEAEAISPDNYEAYDSECLSDFPDSAKPVRQAPAPAPVADDGDDGYDGDDRDGPYEGPRQASSPPSFSPG